MDTLAENNKHVVLVMGKPNTGKSYSLEALTNQDSLVYLNGDCKALPFASKFMRNIPITDAIDVLSFVRDIESTPVVSGAIIDTITFLMNLYERQYVNNAVNGQKAWGEYANYYRDLMHSINTGTKDYAILAHEEVSLNEQSMQMESRVPVKGAVGKIGVTADFSTVLTSKQMPVRKLEGMENDLLKITDEEREDGVKYVFSTRVTKETLGEQTRSAVGLWKRNELYIDNNLDQVFKRLRSYYA